MPYHGGMKHLFLSLLFTVSLLLAPVAHAACAGIVGGDAAFSAHGKGGASQDGPAKTVKDTHHCCYSHAATVFDAETLSVMPVRATVSVSRAHAPPASFNPGPPLEPPAYV